MGGYIPSTPEQRREMLNFLGLSSIDDLFAEIPAAVRAGELKLPAGQGELGVRRQMEALAAKNTVFPTIFRGAGAYRHYIPSIVKSVISKETLITTYTPYQAEMSQGVLQSIFEYQTMMCELTGLDVSNASTYDGASAAAEAVAMCRERKRRVSYISATTQPDVIETVKTYCWAADEELVIIPEKEGRTDMEALSAMLDESAASVYVQQPNYYGLIEDCTAIGEIAHKAGAKFIMGVNPIAAAVLKSAGECGADVAVGEGQPLGLSLSFGGPYLGFMTATKAMMRKLPGRIVGETTDHEGRRAFVLTLQAREQHIRREKASSNLCSNQALCALAAGVYLSAMGPGGLKDVASQSMSKAHYLAAGLEAVGLRRAHEGEFFHEFVTVCDKPDALLSALEAKGILGGLPVEGGILWCATEMNTKDEMDQVIEICREAMAV